MDKASLTLGWLVGKQIAGQRKTQEKQPIAYLYNGVQLPPLPEWDKVKYPYAVIMYQQSNDSYMFSFSAEPFVYGRSIANLTVYALSNSNHTDYNMVKGNGETDWKFLRENSNIQLVLSSYELFWCSIDIMDSSGNVKLTASDPIPVYESDEPEKQLIGYSYNGVVLPDINEVWTDELKQQYPYAVIAYVTAYETNVIVISTAPMYINTNNWVACSADLTQLEYRLNSGTWELTGTFTKDAEALLLPTSYIQTMWSSYDVLCADGSVYSAATDPIPVYE